ncbi:hypothetical protein [Pseudoduganella sp. HUAS MS19]
MSQQINLFNPIFLKQKKIFTTMHMAQTLGMVAAGALLLAVFGIVKTRQLEQHAAAGQAAVAAAEARLAQVVKDFPPRQKNKDIEAEVVRMQDELRGMREVRSVLERGELGNTAGYAEYWRAFARQSVAGVWLTSVSVVGPGKEIGLEGRALQPELLPGYIQRLTREAVLQGKTFGSLEISRPGAVPAAQLAGTAGTEGSIGAPYVEFRLATQPVQPKEGAK